MSEFNNNNNLNNKDNSKKKVLLIVIPIITALFVIGGFVGYKIYSKSVDDTPTKVTAKEEVATDEENVTSEQTHSLTREYKHTTKKMDYIPGMPSSDYKKMKEAPTIAKEETTTEETTEDSTTTKKTSTEQTTQAPKETPTETPKDTSDSDSTNTSDSDSTDTSDSGNSDNGSTDNSGGQTESEAPKQETTEAHTYVCDCGYSTTDKDAFIQHRNQHLDNDDGYGGFAVE